MNSSVYLVLVVLRERRHPWLAQYWACHHPVLRLLLMLRAIHTLVLILLGELSLLLLSLKRHLTHCIRIHHLHLLLIHGVWHLLLLILDAHPRVHHQILTDFTLHHHALVLKHFLREGRHPSKKLRSPGDKGDLVLWLSVIAGFGGIVRALAIPNQVVNVDSVRALLLARGRVV